MGTTLDTHTHNNDLGEKETGGDAYHFFLFFGHLYVCLCMTPGGFSSSDALLNIYELLNLCVCVYYYAYIWYILVLDLHTHTRTNKILTLVFLNLASLES